MPREAKPYIERGWYISRPAGQYLKLCPVESGMTEAKKILKQELARLETERGQMGGRLPQKMTVVEMLVAFLEDVELTKDKDTFLDYQRWCTEFAKVYGTKPAGAVTKTEANDFKLRLMKTTYLKGKQPPRLYKPKTVNHALITMRRAYNWAIDTDRLPSGRNPFAKIDLLHCEGRQRVATDAEYEALLAGTDEPFRDVLVAMRHTSARPQDIYTLTWDMVNWESKMWVITKHKTSHTARNPKPRIIGMSTAVEEVLRRRQAAQGGTGHVFLNEDGKPWTKNALGLRMKRLRERVGIYADERGEQFVLYTHRHTFLTEAGANPDISGSTLMEIAGHTSPATTSRYIHAEKRNVANAGRQVAEKLSGTTPASSD